MNKLMKSAQEIESLDLQEFNPEASFRVGQEDLIKNVLLFLNSPKKYCLLQGSTGIGKSVIALTVSNYMSQIKHEKIFLTTPVNQLLDQYGNKYVHNAKNITFLKGKSNYPCALDPTLSAEDAPCTLSRSSKDCPLKRTACEYCIAQAKAQVTPQLLTNLHVLLINALYTHIYPKRKLLIIDEAHNLESVIAGFYDLTFNEIMMKKVEKIADNLTTNNNNNYVYKKNLRKITQPGVSSEDLSANRFNLIRLHDNDEEINTFLKKYYKKLIKLYESHQELLSLVRLDLLPENKKPDYIEVQKNHKILVKLIEKIELYFNTKTEIQWFATLKKDKKSKITTGVSVKPLQIRQFAPELLSRLADKVLFMSATLGNPSQFCRDLGLKVEDSIYLSAKSTFPAANRPIFLREVGAATYRNMSTFMPLAINEIDKILKENPNVKGVIHTTNFLQCKQIMETSKYKSRMISHYDKDGSTKTDTLLHFYKSKKPLVLLSPSIKEGLDLKEDLCRFQILLKVPWGDLGDPYIAAKLHTDEDSYYNTTSQALEQAYGRGIRSETDKCKFYILDSTFDKLRDRDNGKFISQYITEGIEEGIKIKRGVKRTDNLEVNIF